MQTPAMGTSEPMFNLPRVVVLLAGVMVAMQLIQMLLARPRRACNSCSPLPSFQPATAAPRRSFPAAISPRSPPSSPTCWCMPAGCISSSICMWMAAFGSPVAQRLGDWRFLSFSALCGIAGALTHLAFHFGEMTPVVGASAAISGQMAAAMRFVFGARPRGRGGSCAGSAAKLDQNAQRPAHPHGLSVLGGAQHSFSALASSQSPAPRAISPGRLISAAFCSDFSASASSTPAAGNRFRSSPDPTSGTFRLISNF